MINFFINAITFSFNTYFKYYIVIAIFSLIATMLFIKKSKVKKYIFLNVFVLYLINVVIISLWKWPTVKNCLGMSIYYRPLFSKMHWVPGNFIMDFYHSYLNTNDLWYSSKFLWFTLLNIVYFVPMGIFLKQIVAKNIIVVTMMGLLFSLFIEYLQISGVNHIYNCSWRFFDIDDVITNVIGTIIGYKIWKLGETKCKKRK